MGLGLALTDALSQLILDQDISVDTYNATLGKVYKAPFPLQTRWVTHRPCCAWYTSDLRAMKREKRQQNANLGNHDLRSTSNF